MFTTAPSPKPCENCRKKFIPAFSTTQVCCSMTCAARYAKKVRLSKEKQERAQTRERKAALKRIPDLIKEAQREFNAYVRCRDFGQACICCGLPLRAGEIGGEYDCGHYRSTGSAPHLRFDERNAHAQRKYCNRYGAGRAVDYRVGLIARIGLPAVEDLEGDNRVHKWQRDELIAIRDKYRARVKELKAQKETA